MRKFVYWIRAYSLGKEVLLEVMAENFSQAIQEAESKVTKIDRITARRISQCAN